MLRLWRRVEATEGAALCVAGLDLDFRGAEFGWMPHLSREGLRAGAAEVHRLTTRCRVTPGCGRAGTRSLRKDPADREVVRVGGAEAYVAACEECHVAASR